MKISYINQLYSNEFKTIQYLHVPCSELSVFYQEITRYKRECERLDNDSQLLEVYYLLRRCFFKLCGSLLPYADVLPQEVIKELLKKLQLIKRNFPEFFKRSASPMAKAFKTVIDMQSNRISEYICKYLKKDISNNSKIAIVLKKTFTIRDEEFIVGQLRRILPFRPNVFIFSENSFRKNIMTFDKVLFIGTPDYFEPLVITTIKAKTTTFISYDMFSNEYKKTSIFYDLRDHVFSTLIENINFGEPLKRSESMLSSELKSVEVQTAIQNILKNQTQNINSEEMIHPVEAQIVYLENGNFIFASKESKIKIIEPEGKGNIHHVCLKDLEEGDYIILRNERDNRLIAETADSEILKEDTDRVRKLQECWKNQLRLLLRRKGMSRLCYELTYRYGMKTAKPASIRNWCSDESIFPRELPQLLGALGFEQKEALDIIAAMKKIQSAHIQAGRLISKMLEKEITNEVYRKLLETGSYTFTSTLFKGASFNIERIIGVSDETHEVMPYNLMKPFKAYD
jgi:hypothetical protein